MRALVGLCVRHYGAVTALERAGAGPGVLGCAAVRRSMCFPNSFPRRSTSRPRRRDSRRSRSRNWSPGRSRTPSTAPPGLATHALGVHSRTVRRDHHISRTTSMCTSPARASPSVCRNWAAACRRASGAPKLSPLVSSTMDLLKIGLLSDKVDAYALRDTADWIIKPRLLAVPGVAHVIVFGGNVRQIQIQPDMQQAWRASASRSPTLPMRRRPHCRCAAPASSTSPAQRILLQSPTPAPDIAPFRARRSSPCATASPILLRDVAEVKIAPALRSGDALIMGKPGVLLSLASQYGANTLTTTLAVEKALADLRAGPEGAGHHAVFRPAPAREFHRAGAGRPASSRC